MAEKSKIRLFIFHLKIKPLIMNNTDLGGKMLSFDCKGTNVEPYNCVTKN